VNPQSNTAWRSNLSPLGANISGAHSKNERARENKPWRPSSGYIPWNFFGRALMSAGHFSEPRRGRGPALRSTSGKNEGVSGSILEKILRKPLAFVFYATTPPLFTGIGGSHPGPSAIGAGKKTPPGP